MNDATARPARLVLSLLVIAAIAMPVRAADDHSRNLLVNGDAETHTCTDDWTAQTPVPGWRVVRGAAAVLCYSAFAWTQETPSLPAGGSGGRALFAAPGSDTAIEQTVDLAAASDAVDRGKVAFTLSGWLGGWGKRPERAILSAVFLDDSGRATRAPVVAGDATAAARAYRTALLERSVSGTLPAGTRRIVVTVDFMSGMTSFHNAYADNLSLTLAGAGDLRATRPATPPIGRIPPLDHVFVVMMENTNFADVVHRFGTSTTIDTRMPFLAGLARHGVLFTDLWATYHPSDQNYVAMVAGDTFKYGPVYYPDYDLPANHLGDLLEASGKTWRAYVQNMKTPCNLAADASGQGYYAPDDQPFAHFHDVIADPARCRATLRDLSDFHADIAARSLPDFAWIAADGWWDGEGAWYDNFDMATSLARQDEFLKTAFAPLLSSKVWNDSRSLLIVTWDESLGWGWPDNRVPTLLVGSPGLVKEGAIVDTRSDAYGLLRTVEEALGTGGLGRFDSYAQPLSEAFSGNDSGGPITLQADVSAATRGTLSETFGRVGAPAAVERGQLLVLRTAEPLPTGSFVAIEPTGRIPSATSKRYPLGTDGIATIRTSALAEGAYAAWLLHSDEYPRHAGVPISILPKARVGEETPGVEIVGGASPDLAIREGSNLVLRYCRSDRTAPGDAWIGIFGTGTPIDQMTKDAALAIGYWLKAPGSPVGAPCGEAPAAVSELVPGASYDALLMQRSSDGVDRPVGRPARFTVTPALPH